VERGRRAPGRDYRVHDPADRTESGLDNSKEPVALPGTAEELQRRRECEQYRNLIRSDITLARSMGVGRPDLSRTYSDGGLLDLNSLSPEALARFCPMPFDEAQAIVVVRQRRGRFLGIDDVAAQTSLSEPTMARLRETAVFL
jgi:DNA uptake protein ComE-like DNA-binding protein